MFYLKLAKNNLKVNRSIYFPFLLSMIFLVVMNTIMQILLNNKGMSDLPGASSAKELFDLGSIIILIFSFIFSIYTNSFLLKQRKKELGLYNVLGLGKKEIRYVLFFEILIAYIITMIVGLLIGTIFSRLCFLILKNMASLGVNFTFSVNLDSYVLIMSYFLLIFVLLFLWNSWQIRRMNPVELLKGTQQGEKEPKGNWFIGIVGLIMLGTAYYISVSIQSPLEAFVKFFIAVILVIIATYALFSTTSILIRRL
ncbi:FtsX-like permease family protein [Vagococcus jeotgali]|uniref:FtsX-like permease family protein n=1 Tax=Vagococcus jeotgali TaxID=3109030 RepID=UPI002DDA6C5B|nr:FtsX-like permease family protein [Vagococcus sp. B2T-5]